MCAGVGWTGTGGRGAAQRGTHTAGLTLARGGLATARGSGNRWRHSGAPGVMGKHGHHKQRLCHHRNNPQPQKEQAEAIPLHRESQQCHARWPRPLSTMMTPRSSPVTWRRKVTVTESRAAWGGQGASASLQGGGERRVGDAALLHLECGAD